MNDHDKDCGHSQVQHLVMQMAEEMVAVGMLTMRRDRSFDPASAGMSIATMLFAAGLETGLRASLMDPIGGQFLIEHFNDASEISGTALDEANQVISDDARHLLEAMARVMEPTL